jgi:hypothetical protein
MSLSMRSIWVREGMVASLLMISSLNLFKCYGYLFSLRSMAESFQLGKLSRLSRSQPRSMRTLTFLNLSSSFLISSVKLVILI